MIIIRKGQERGNTRLDWLNSQHTFSFGEYYDPQFMGFETLRVINEDTVQPNMGFGQHPHSNMEIISYVIEGAIEHKDSLGNGSIIKPGEIQRMSAGTGVLHSEFNPSQSDSVHFLQIWILPDKNGITPSYEQKSIPKINNNWILIGSKEGGDNTVKIHQDVEIYAAYMTQGQILQTDFSNFKNGWIQVVTGEVTLNNHDQLSAGDGAAIKMENQIGIESQSNAELLLFKL